MEYGLIGEHLQHSCSREIHRVLANLADCGMPSYSYELCELSPECLPAFFTARDFRGINVTLPYKQAVIPLLDKIDEAAERIGAVNCVVNRGGVLTGYNTDFGGMVALLEHEGVALDGRKVLILGTGGTSHTACAVAQHLGAKQVVLASRNPQRAGAAREANTPCSSASASASASGEGVPSTGLNDAREDCENAASDSSAVDEGGRNAMGTVANHDVPIVSYNDACQLHADADVIINTTPCGMWPHVDQQPISLVTFANLKAVVDAIYNPRETALMRDARSRGVTACDGWYMLVAQAVLSAQLFFQNGLMSSSNRNSQDGFASCGSKNSGSAPALLANQNSQNNPAAFDNRNSQNGPAPLNYQQQDLHEACAATDVRQEACAATNVRREACALADVCPAICTSADTRALIAQVARAFKEQEER